MKNKKILPAILVTVLVSSCASRPESIPASYISHERYIDNNCEQLATNKIDTWMDLSVASEKQNDAANGDAIGVFLIGVPFSQLSGDHEAEVAKYKGMIEAIETAQIKNDCKFKALPKLAIEKEADPYEDDYDYASYGEEKGDTTATAAASASVEERLVALKSLRNKEVISEDEYRERKRIILDEL